MSSSTLPSAVHWPKHLVVAQVEAFFHAPSGAVTYVVTDAGSRACAIIDSVMDFDSAAARTSSESADQLVDWILQRELETEWILETHVHADHLSAAPYLQSKLGGKTAVGTGIAEVQACFAPIFGAELDFKTDGSQFDVLFDDGARFSIGNIEAEVLHTPGHTPSCVSYLVGDCVFTGDTLFMPDFGTARTDFPGGDARTLFQSIQRLLALPDDTRLFVGHDYVSDSRSAHAWQTTVMNQREENIHIGGGTTEADFVLLREARDETLAVPGLLLPAVQINMRGGNLPPPENDGVSYLKLPLNVFGT